MLYYANSSHLWWKAGQLTTIMSFTQDKLTQGSPEQKATLGKGLGYGVNVTIKKYVSYIVVISFTGGGNRSDRTKY